MHLDLQGTPGGQRNHKTRSDEEIAKANVATVVHIRHSIPKQNGRANYRAARLRSVDSDQTVQTVLNLGRERSMTDRLSNLASLRI